MDQVITQLVAGLAQGSTLFLVAIGLSLTLGVMDLLNFGNGAFLLFGGYGILLLFGNGQVALGLFLVGLVVVGLASGVIGGVLEVSVIRRLYHLPHLFPLLGTYALFLIVQGIALVVFGVAGQPAPTVEFTTQSYSIFGLLVSKYSVLLILLGLVVLGGVWLAVNRTRWGLLVRATAWDRDAAQILGINVRRVFLAMFALSAILVSVAGGALTLLVNLNPNFGGQYLIESFVVVIVGGIGSILGTYVAAIGLGLIVSLTVLFYPQYASAVFYAAMVAAIIWRPSGILRRKGAVGL